MSGLDYYSRERQLLQTFSDVSRLFRGGRAGSPSGEKDDSAEVCMRAELVHLKSRLPHPIQYRSQAAQAELSWMRARETHWGENCTQMKWVWLLWNHSPGGVWAALVLFDVEFPVGIEVS
jgi:hypothetical protein